MRKVYHGAIQEIAAPLVHVGRDNLDFGKGFYVTDIKNQATQNMYLVFLADST